MGRAVSRRSLTGPSPKGERESFERKSGSGGTSIGRLRVARDGRHDPNLQFTLDLAGVSYADSIQAEFFERPFQLDLLGRR